MSLFGRVQMLVAWLLLLPATVFAAGDCDCHGTVSGSSTSEKVIVGLIISCLLSTLTCVALAVMLWRSKRKNEHTVPTDNQIEEVAGNDAYEILSRRKLETPYSVLMVGHRQNSRPKYQGQATPLARVDEEGSTNTDAYETLAKVKTDVEYSQLLIKEQDNDVVKGKTKPTAARELKSKQKEDNSAAADNEYETVAKIW